MTDVALTSASTYAQVRVREPLGDRTFDETPTIGGEGTDIVVPGTVPGVAVQIERHRGVWLARPVNNTRIRFNGRPLKDVRDLRRHDVLAVGDAQVIVTDVTRTLLRLEVCHLTGNATISPAGFLSTIEQGDSDEDLLIPVPPPRLPIARPSPPLPTRKRFQPLAAVIAVIVMAVAVYSLLIPVALDVEPDDTRIHVPGTLIAVRTGGELWVLPGVHIVRGEHDGYVPAQISVRVSKSSAAVAYLHLAKLPGFLTIDTAGIPAIVSVDGVEAGRAPGVLKLSSGSHTITLRAPRYVDYISTVVIEGAGARQSLKAALQPSWGTLQISAIPAGAHVSVDGVDSGVAPAVVDAPSGVRQIRISALNLKTWESSVVLKAGEALTVGPITLGQPDAHLSLKSVPSGADVTVGGQHRGRTPLELDLPSGIQHELVLNAAGYAPWTRAVFAEAGKKTSLEAKLEFAGARVTVQGDPDGAQLFIDGVESGRTPQSLELSAVEHRIEVRQQGWVTYTAAVTPAKGLDRTLQYRLIPDDRSRALAQTASTLYTQTGYLLRLVPPGTFKMGSERREQGRRPNEGFRQVTLKRPLYFGATEVTNEQFRRFRPDHTSGFVDRHSIDLDDQPVSQVSWNEAAEYCNWLSERDSLPDAYERRDDTYVLKRPVTMGYRLPTEAEWEYAARYAAPGQFRRFGWGDALPVAADAGNLAGAETGSSLAASLPGYRDPYPVAAPVGRFKPSPLGLHDLSGNVSEWINDYYLSFVDPAPATDPLGPEDGTRHVIRGASWKTAVASDLRLAWRDGADGSSPTIGFRVVRYAE